jgi:hypothetical protein
MIPGQQDPEAAVAPHAFRDVGLAQGISLHGRANAPVGPNSGPLLHA